MGLNSVSSRTPASFSARGIDAHGIVAGPRMPLLSPRRRAMVLLGSAVLGASILGTVVGHLLSAPSPI